MQAPPVALPTCVGPRPSSGCNGRQPAERLQPPKPVETNTIPNRSPCSHEGTKLQHDGKRQSSARVTRVWKGRVEFKSDRLARQAQC
eukprot:13169318-Alexandrium_andersonii.AAC.1